MLVGVETSGMWNFIRFYSQWNGCCCCSPALTSSPSKTGHGCHGCRKLGATMRTKLEVPKTRDTLSKAPCVYGEPDPIVRRSSRFFQRAHILLLHAHPKPQSTEVDYDMRSNSSFHVRDTDNGCKVCLPIFCLNKVASELVASILNGCLGGKTEIHMPAEHSSHNTTCTNSHKNTQTILRV